MQEGAVAKAVNKISNDITGLTERLESIKSNTLERIAVGLYCIGHMLMCLVHEPWFDEALSWLIARDSSVYEIMFVTPHYEGHPALWHLILVPFAKLGTPYELSLSIVSLFFSGLAVFLFVYKSPFKRIIRLTIPFTYYMFYQYSVISRPYCIMMLAFVLMAMTFKNRDKKPGRFVLSMWLLCLSSAYGIVISGGICIAWLIEMLYKAFIKSKEKNSDNGEYRGALRVFFEDHLFFHRKFFWLLGLLLYVIFIIWRIMPAENTYASLVSSNTVADNGLIVRLLYTVFASLSDLFITNVFYTSGTLRNADFYFGELIIAVIIGAAIIACLITFCAKKKDKVTAILHLVIPYTMLSVFGAIVYLFYHHIGINLLFIGFWLWVISDTGENKLTKSGTTEANQKASFLAAKYQVLYDFGKIALILMILIPVYWSISSCVTDVFASYGSGREQYEFLEENGLDNGYTILADWYKVFDMEEAPENFTEYDLIFSQQGVNLAPYLKNSKIINSPNLAGKTYSYLHEIPGKSQMKEMYNRLIASGTPDIIIGKPDLKDTENSLEIHGSAFVDYNNYTSVYKMTFGNIKKGVKVDTTTYIYVRNDIVRGKGLKAYD